MNFPSAQTPDCCSSPSHIISFINTHLGRPKLQRGQQLLQRRQYHVCTRGQSLLWPTFYFLSKAPSQVWETDVEPEEKGTLGEGKAVQRLPAPLFLIKALCVWAACTGGVHGSAALHSLLLHGETISRDFSQSGGMLTQTSGMLALLLPLPWLRNVQ